MSSFNTWFDVFVMCLLILGAAYWSSNGYLNQFIKLIYFAGALLSIIVVGKDLGWI